MKKSLEAADFKALRIGGRDKDRTCDPYDVNAKNYFLPLFYFGRLFLINGLFPLKIIYFSDYEEYLFLSKNPFCWNPDVK